MSSSEQKRCQGDWDGPLELGSSAFVIHRWFIVSAAGHSAQLVL